MRKRETNFEHYYDYEGKHRKFPGNYEGWTLYFKNGAWAHFRKTKNRNAKDMADWLLNEEYKEPKTIYKLTQLEYDLLKLYSTKLKDKSSAKLLLELQEKGHFSDIPKNIMIKDILNSCEVVQRD